VEPQQGKSKEVTLEGKRSGGYVLSHLQGRRSPGGNRTTRRKIDEKGIRRELQNGSIKPRKKGESKAVGPGIGKKIVREDVAKRAEKRRAGARYTPGSFTNGRKRRAPKRRMNEKN